jgi:hypothetical protein
MNEQDQELARQAGLEFTYDPTETPMSVFVEARGEDLEAFADLIRADAMEVATRAANESWTLACKKMVEFEREACAVLAEKTICDTHIPTGINIYGTRAAKAIRARGNT